MSYGYSIGLCRDALRHLSSNGKYLSRVTSAFGEMGVSKQGDTSPEIYQEWKELKEKFRLLYNANYQDIDMDVASEEVMREVNQCREAIIGIICDWIEYNGGQLGKGIRKAS